MAERYEQWVTEHEMLPKKKGSWVRYEDYNEELSAFRTENKRLRKALKDIVSVGHDDDCLLCGLKDRRATGALKENVEEE